MLGKKLGKSEQPPPVIGLGFGGYGEWSKEVDSLIGQLAEIASEVPERLGCCHGQAQAQGQYAQWARKHLHRESLREVSRCRHAALDRLLLRPTKTFAGEPDHCRMMDDSPNDPGVANAWESSDAPSTHVVRMRTAPTVGHKPPLLSLSLIHISEPTRL